jgi:hypothetical protein
VGRIPPFPHWFIGVFVISEAVPEMRLLMMEAGKPENKGF